VAVAVPSSVAVNLYHTIGNEAPVPQLVSFGTTSPVAVGKLTAASVNGNPASSTSMA